MKNFFLRNKTKKVIKKRAKDAIRFLKKTGVLKNEKKPALNSLPYYVMLGPQNSGKTTVLTKSELKFILGKKFNDPKKIKTTKNYTWWATEYAVIIDTPGQYFTTIKNKINYLQKYFFRLIKKYNHTVPPTGILLVLDINDLQHKSKTLKLINRSSGY